MRKLVAKPVLNRRAFLRGAGAVAVSLPFLESMPERSAWAQDKPPVFGLFIVAACGVVGSKFFPNDVGPLSASSLAGMTDKATSVLAPHADNLLFIRHLNFPMANVTGCGHAQGLCQALTAAPSEGSAQNAYATSLSADMRIAQLVNPNGADPLTLYAGNKKNGYIAERISFKAGGAGQVRPADDNPYTLYTKLMGFSQPSSAGASSASAELITTRKSVNDLVRGELSMLLRDSRLSGADRQRLQQHFDSVREAELTMGKMAASCSADGLATSQIEALQGGLAFKTNGMIEDVAKLHLELVALAFACNFNRVATLQHGDGTDATKYNVPANASLGWPFHHLSHRVQSDSQTGMNSTAEQAHAEIDVLRMKTLLHGLDAFKARGLFDTSFIMWTNHVADGPSHSFKNVPHIIAGNAGGYLKQGVFIDAANATNNKLFNTLISATVRDKNTEVLDFGKGMGSGHLEGVRA